MEKKQKRFYKVDEMVWVIGDKKEGKIKSINRDNLEVVVVIKDISLIERVTNKVLKPSFVEKTLKMWEIDKLKYNAKNNLVKEKTNLEQVQDILRLVGDIFNPEVYFAKVKKTANIPSKRLEDAGYDIYANIEKKLIGGNEIYELYVPAFQTTLVPTGVAVALPNTHYLNVKHERGSTSGHKKGSEHSPSMSVLAGVVDSGYRGEIFVALTPLHKDVLITSEVDEVTVHENVILYPYSKAIAQATIDLVPQPVVKEIEFEELSKIKSERGDTKLGQSGK